MVAPSSCRNSCNASTSFRLRNSNALWWKQLGANSAVSNFQYDLYFYLKNPSAAQALEFDVNQSLNGYKYIFGTECNLRGTYAGYWRVYDSVTHWQNTGVACTGITAGIGTATPRTDTERGTL